MVSRKLVEAVKLNRQRGYQIAHAAGLHPSTLSKILNGIERVSPGDPRVLAVCRVLGLAEQEAFDHDTEATA
jgi:transcriptional regulator with XRE-family HTH domain